MNNVVARYQDGKLIKGVTNDFLPAKDRFHLLPVAGGGKPVEVVIADLKALFFIKDFTGNKEYQETNRFDPAQRVIGRKIRVLFKDGELMVGSTQGYQQGRPGFFVTPADPKSNNDRCFVVTAATKEVSFV